MTWPPEFHENRETKINTVRVPSILLVSFIPLKEIDRISNFGHGATTEDYSRCFDKNDYPNVANDIFEIRAGGDDGIGIHVSIIDEETRKDLLFGQNAGIDFITIDSNGNYCYDDREAAASIKIQNGAIIESKCVELSWIIMINEGHPSIFNITSCIKDINFE